jgi:HAD superfamily phosphatase (TIGR01668 family)
MILEPFYPKEWVDSTYEIDWEMWKSKGIRGVIFDIDNTLVCHGAPADDRAIQLFKRLHGLGIQTCLLSNNKKPRVASFGKAVGSPYIFKADKPCVKNYNKAMKQMGTERETTLFVGDQLFTDVYGANRAGIYGILVKPINPKEEIQIVLKRALEAFVLHFYKKKKIVEKTHGLL